MGKKKISKFYPLFLTLSLWFVNPPEDLNVVAFRLFIIFISVILSLLIQAIPMAVSVIAGLTFSVITELITLKSALKGFSDSTTWLVVNAFLIAGVIINTGLGRRISLLSIYYLGKTMKGLGYAICSAEFILGPLVPSNTARGGGILAPIVDSISKELGSRPSKSPQKAGEFLHLVGAHANLITAAMFLTGMAANPLVSKAAKEVFNVDFGWLDWALGAIVPGIIGLAGLPLIIMYLAPPKIDSIEPVRKKIINDLSKLGPWKRSELITSVIMLSMLFLWLTKSLHSIGTTTVTFCGLISILILNVATWEDIVKNHKAWDTLIWLGGLLTLATNLKELGFITWFAENLQNSLSNFTPLVVVMLLVVIYFYSMYVFSMLTAHIVALASVIFVIASNIQFEPFIIIALVAYLSSLSGCLTNYSTGPVIIYFGNGYSTASNWFKVGFLISLYHLIIWLGIGSIWWKIIGWW